ncbi:hypothetical protein [Flammeovirga sp. EKP202]|uniref:hypothetical protein n=1 Tax=Flammeovirga sp. EKP202 TaxID=2770592 RepID=UPI001CB88A55|nr:hypothetical protein [Flammeovirga sp. EKP202]
MCSEKVLVKAIEWKSYIYPESKLSPFNQKKYFFLMDTTMIPFDKGKIFYNQNEIAFADAVEIGGFELIKIN